LNKFNPLVSIIIPVFNGSNYLEDAIHSALSQTYKNIEILVINDGSNDYGATEKIAKQFGEKIRYFHQQNGGCGSALNLGIKHMKGEYFSWLSHDDLYTPDKVESQISLLETLVNKNTIIFSAFDLIDEHSNPKALVLPHKQLTGDKFKIPLMPLLRGLIHGCTLLIPKKLFDEIGIFDVRKRTTQDYALWFDFLRQTPLEYIYEPLVKARIHSDQDTQKINALHLRECNELWSGFLEQLSLDEMKKLDGSHFGFLANMADHLAITPYDLAREKAAQSVLDMITSTKVSVILIAQDSIETTQITINSVIAQTHQNLEIYVVHHHSLDQQAIVDLNKGLIPIHYQSFSNEFSKNNAIVDVINQVQGRFISFIQAGDIFKSHKIFDQVKWMLRNDASISVTALESTHQHLTPSVEPKELTYFSRHGFPSIIFELDHYFSTLMIDTRAAQIFTAQPNNIADNGLPLWVSAFTLYDVCYLDQALTMAGNNKSDDLTDLQRLFLQKMLRIACINSTEFVLATNLSHRINKNTLAMDEFITHQLKAIYEYEERLLEFWSPRPKNVVYANTSLRAESKIIQEHLKLMVAVYQYRLHKHLVHYQLALRKRLVKIQQTSFADCEGYLVRLIKPLIPVFLWRYSTALYRKIRQLITSNK
jgi:glycosyltransferase involved in cell wall biosynthesis